jgi:hypothetical protein
MQRELTALPPSPGQTNSARWTQASQSVARYDVYAAEAADQVGYIAAGTPVTSATQVVRSAANQLPDSPTSTSYTPPPSRPPLRCGQRFTLARLHQLSAATGLSILLDKTYVPMFTY